MHHPFRALAIACVLAFAPVLAAVGILTGQSAQAAGGGTTLYLPNVTKMLGGSDGWQTPFIVQNVGTVATDVTMYFYAFSDGSLVKTRTVAALAPGTSVFHDPNHDDGLFPGGQYSVVVQSATSPIVTVVNEHQNVSNQARQEALSYLGLSSGSTKVFLPYFAYNVNGWLTTVIIQNLGSVPTTLSASFKSFDATKTATLTRTIAPGRSVFIDPRIEATLVAATEYSVTLSADQPVGAVVNAHNDAAGVAAPMGFSYNGVPASDDGTVFLPYVQRNVQGSTSRILVQNMAPTPITPTLRFRLLALITQPVLVPGPTLAPGATWSYDPKSNLQLIDGEYSMTITGGQFAALGASIGPSSAAGASAANQLARTLYLPNITKTLGGTTGWTTPINLQTSGASNATLRWYRFSDGALIYTQTVIFNDFGQTLRIDPRAIPALPDDTQFAVVVTAGQGGVAATVTELNFQGGDGAMTYEGITAPFTVPVGTNACTPESGAAGTTFRCLFTGLQPYGIVTATSVSSPSGTPSTGNPNDHAGADGSYNVYFTAAALGIRTVSLTSGGVTKTASFTVTPQTFPITIVQSKNGMVAAITSPGLACDVYVQLSTGTAVQDAALVTKISDASGNVSWTYATQSGAPSGTHQVQCTSGATSPASFASFTIP